MTKDLKVAWRSLRQRPGFAFLAVAPLAIGIGFATTIFSIASALLLRPLPFFDGNRLMALQSLRADEKPGQQEFNVSASDYEDWSRENRAFVSIGGSAPSAFNLTGSGSAARIPGSRATASLLPTLGVAPILGRSFSEEETRTDTPVALLSWELWKGRFGGDAGILGRTILLDGRACSVIGILPAAFRFGSPADAWIPYRPTPAARQSRAIKELVVVGRLKPGLSRSRALSEMRGIAAATAKSFPDTSAGWSVSVRPLRDTLVENVRSAIWILFGAAGFLLAIACANVSNLLLARAVERRGEAVVRAALGADRATLLKFFLAESAMLAAAGGAIGVLVSWATLNPLLSACPVELAAVGTIGIDLRVLAFSVLVSAAAALVFGSAAAIQGSRVNLAAALSDAGRSSSAGRIGRRFQSALVAGQIGMVFLLLTGAAAALVAFRRLNGVDPGFPTRNALTVRLAVPEARYPEAADRAALLKRIDDAIAAIPGVTAVGATTKLPLDESYGLAAFQIEGRTTAAESDQSLAQFRRVTPRYLPSMEIPLTEGRQFEAADDTGHPLVAIVSREFVRRYWPGGSPIGKRLRITSGDRPWIAVVGVAEDVRDFSLASGPTATLYVPYAQRLARQPDVDVVIRTSRPAAALARPIRERLAAIDPELPAGAIQPLGSLIADSLKRQRFQMLLMMLLAGTGALLAAIGTFGLISYSVAQQSRELSIRMALGATAGGIVGFVVRRGLLLGAAGIAAGAAGSLICRGILAGALPGTPAPGPATFLAVAALLGSICAVSSYLAARRSSRIAPAQALARAGAR